MSTTETTESAHKHGFPCNPPGGTFLNPGPCECGKTYSEGLADKLLAEAVEALELAYGDKAPVSTHWAVAWGTTDLNDGIGYVELYDDEEDAREHVPFYKDGSVAKRTVISLPWENVPDEGPAS